jgi:hypothetical protein
MPLLEDLRLWGNKLSSIPPPILYADCKKIIGYLRATERERLVIANQMRSLQGPRSSSRMSIKSTTQASRSNRAHSATRAMSQQERRFAPLGFYDGDELPDASPHMPGSSRSVGGGGLGASQHGHAASFGNMRSASARGMGHGGSGRNHGGGGGLGDSGSEAEDFGSDDEFTSMFRAVTSRTESFTNLAGGGAFGGGGGAGGMSAANTTESGSRVSSGGSSRRSTQPLSRSPVPPSNASPSLGQHHSSTIVQPFQSSGFSLGMSLVSGPGVTNSAKLSSSPAHSGRRGSNGAPGLQAIRDTHDRDDESDPDDVEAEHSTKGENLTDLVRRDWKPVSAIPDLQPSMSKALSERAGSPGPASSHPFHPDSEAASEDVLSNSVDPALMEEWDMQSQAIENKKQQMKKVGKIGEW